LGEPRQAVENSALAFRWHIDPVGEQSVHRCLEDLSSAVVKVMLDTDISAATDILRARNYMDTGSTAAAVA
jgi:hypothetical protein